MPRGLSQVKAVADYFAVTVDYLVYGKEDIKKDSIMDYNDEMNAVVFEVILEKVKQ